MENNEYKTPLLCRKCGNIGYYRCSGCKNVIYCSQKCQIDDWQKHKSECINNNSKIHQGNIKNENEQKLSKSLTNKNNSNNNNNNSGNNNNNIKNKNVNITFICIAINNIYNILYLIFIYIITCISLCKNLLCSSNA